MTHRTHRLARGCWLALAGLTACGPLSAPTDPEPVQPPAEIPTEAQPSGPPVSHVVYVPAYSHLDRDDRGRHNLSVLLSVRNMDSVADIWLTHVDYFDSSGHRVRRFVGQPRRLGPLETADFRVSTGDDAGGSGANFLVYWDGPADAHPVLTEAVMYGHVGVGYLSFTSRGVELDRRPDPASFDAPSTGAETVPEPPMGSAP